MQHFGGWLFIFFCSKEKSNSQSFYHWDLLAGTCISRENSACKFFTVTGVLFAHTTPALHSEPFGILVYTYRIQDFYSKHLKQQEKVICNFCKYKKQPFPIRCLPDKLEGIWKFQNFQTLHSKLNGI